MKELIKNIGKKRLLLTVIGFIVAIIIVIILLLLYNSLFSTVSYEQIENEVLTAAKRYYGDNKELLPKNINEQVSTNDKNLTSAGYLKSMDKLTKRLGTTCDAEVLVSYANDDYRYRVLLNCEDKFNTHTFVNYIKNHETITTSGQGLYNLNNELVYRGENPNNFVNVNGKLWRIVKIENDNILLIYNDELTNYVWDDRFNAYSGSYDGINNYTVSRIYEKITQISNGDSKFMYRIKNVVAPHDIYIGKRSSTSTINDGSEEKKDILKNQYIGMLPLYDYLNASIDENCTRPTYNSCTNYNYLKNYEYDWWLITADIENEYDVFKVNSSGRVSTAKASQSGYFRPTIYLAKDVIYAGGNGTELDPYIIK